MVCRLVGAKPLTNAGILLIGPLGTNFSEILIGIETFSFTKMRLKISSAKWRLFGLDLNVLSNPNPRATWQSLSGNQHRTTFSSVAFLTQMLLRLLSLLTCLMYHHCSLSIFLLSHVAMILLTTVYIQTGYIHYVIHVQFIFASIKCYQMIDSEKKYSTHQWACKCM